MKKLQTYPLVLLISGLYVVSAFAQGDPIASEVPPTFSEVEAPIISPVVTSKNMVKVSISTPADGAIIKAGSRTVIKYEIVGMDGVHGQLYVDGKKSEYLKKPIGMDRIPKLSAGSHEICVQALNKSHTNVGEPTCIKVTAQ